MTDYTIRPCKGRDLDAGGNCRCGCGYNSDEHYFDGGGDEETAKFMANIQKDPNFRWMYFYPRSEYDTNAVKPVTSERQAVLDEAGELIHGDRNVAYGPPMQNFQRIADLWNTYLDDQLKAPILPSQVGWMSMLIKVARNIEAPKRDNAVDAAGYIACAYECEVNEDV
jgi:hypothetical protein